MSTSTVIRPVSKALYLGLYLGGSIIGGILLAIGFIATGAAAAAAEEGAIPEGTSTAIAGFGVFVICAAGIVCLAAAVVQFVLYYKMWAAIQDGQARTTPGKAVGLLFIPIFNIYWTFQVVWGFSKDYNTFIQRHSIPVKPVSEKLFLWACIVPYLGVVPFIGWLAHIASVVFQAMVINAGCDAINALVYSAAAPEPVSDPSAEAVLHPLPIQPDNP